MFERLSEIKDQIAVLEEQLADPVVLARSDQLAELGRKHAELLPIVRAHDAWKVVAQDAADAEELLTTTADPDEQQFFEAQLHQAKDEMRRIEADLTELLAPQGSHDERDVILELRAAAGGEEAALFAANLARMYARYGERKGWKVDMLASRPTGIGGLRDVTLEVRGHDVYGHLKFEGGTHRVQRVPETETTGRIHTSTVTVAALAEADEVEVSILPGDIQVDVFRSSGPGGQSVNTTDSAVRITHVPTGIVVTCQDEKSQRQNREKATRVLRARLLEIEQERQHEEVAADRRTQVGTGKRSEKIRTYNFPQNRVTDHRLGLSVHDLASVLDGDLDSFVDALRKEARARQLDDTGRLPAGAPLHE